jgi:proline iminopeptidase
MRLASQIVAVLLAAGTHVACSGSERDQSLEAGRDTGTVMLSNAQLPYVVEGSGRPCLVIGSRLYYPRTFSSRFRSELRCVYLDQRGFVAGSDARADGTLGIEGVVADIEDARRALGLDRVVLVGHSIHGLIALAYARRYPAHVTHVIAIGGPPEYTERLSASLEPFWTSQASPGRKAAHELNVRRVSRDSLATLTPSQAFITTYVTNAATYWADSTYDGRWLWDGIELNMTRVGEIFDLERPFSFTGDTVRIETPVFVALGRLDFAVPYTLWDDFRGPFANLTVHVFERSGHTPQLEEPDAFDERVLAWLTQ